MLHEAGLLVRALRLDTQVGLKKRSQRPVRAPHDGGILLALRGQGHAPVTALVDHALFLEHRERLVHACLRDIELLRNEINKVLCKYTWQMFAAESDDEFEALWAKMVDEMDGLDYQTLFDYDCQKWQVEVDAKIAAAAAQ